MVWIISQAFKCYVEWCGLSLKHLNAMWNGVDYLSNI